MSRLLATQGLDYYEGKPALRVMKELQKERREVRVFEVDEHGTTIVGDDVDRGMNTARYNLVVDENMRVIRVFRG